MSITANLACQANKIHDHLIWQYFLLHMHIVYIITVKRISKLEYCVRFKLWYIKTQFNFIKQMIFHTLVRNILIESGSFRHIVLTVWLVTALFIFFLHCDFVVFLSINSQIVLLFALFYLQMKKIKPFICQLEFNRKIYSMVINHFSTPSQHKISRCILN